MASKKTRKSKRPPRTAIVPRVVFQTVVAAAVVPTMGAVALGCDHGVSPATDAGFSVVAPLTDAGRDAGMFSVALPLDAGNDAGFSVAAPLDAGMDAAFSVAAPLDAGPDQGFFAVVALPPDGAFSVLVAPFDANTSS